MPRRIPSTLLAMGRGGRGGRVLRGPDSNFAVAATRTQAVCVQCRRETSGTSSGPSHLLTSNASNTGASDRGLAGARNPASAFLKGQTRNLATVHHHSRTILSGCVSTANGLIAHLTNIADHGPMREYDLRAE
jgi:hypothetical protein